MKYYAICGDKYVIADTKDALTRFYENVFELPEDYEKGKYILGEVDKEIDVPEYDEEGNPIIIEYEDIEIVIDYDEEGNPIGQHEITVIKKKQKTHKEIVKVKMLVLNPEWEQTEITRLKNLLNEENTKKAKQAVEQGYIEFHDALFETNSQTVSDLTSAMLIMKESEMSVYPWLSMDDKYIELTLEDFGTLGGLIAGFKAHIWNTEYLGYKTRIALAQTVEELKNIVISY